MTPNSDPALKRVTQTMRVFARLQALRWARESDIVPAPVWRRGPSPLDRRSEEHTSELQSLMRTSYPVFCLKQKNKPCTNIIEDVMTSMTTTHTSTIRYIHSSS